ncbi:MAG: hypothetical protein ACYCQJ_14795 [Nitrososphaerales archaeon]
MLTADLIDEVLLSLSTVPAAYLDRWSKYNKRVYTKYEDLYRPEIFCVRDNIMDGWPTIDHESCWRQNGNLFLVSFAYRTEQRQIDVLLSRGLKVQSKMVIARGGPAYVVLVAEPKVEIEDAMKWAMSKDGPFTHRLLF